MKQDLQNRYDELSRMMFGLECSDEGLFSNANGNLPMYKAWQKEQAEIARKLEHFNDGRMGR